MNSTQVAQLVENLVACDHRLRKLIQRNEVRDQVPLLVPEGTALLETASLDVGVQIQPTQIDELLGVELLHKHI